MLMLRLTTNLTRGASLFAPPSLVKYARSETRLVSLSSPSPSRNLFSTQFGVRRNFSQQQSSNNSNTVRSNNNQNRNHNNNQNRNHNNNQNRNHNNNQNRNHNNNQNRNHNNNQNRNHNNNQNRNHNNNQNRNHNNNQNRNHNNNQNRSHNNNNQNRNNNQQKSNNNYTNRVTPHQNRNVSGKRIDTAIAPKPRVDLGELPVDEDLAVDDFVETEDPDRVKASKKFGKNKGKSKKYADEFEDGEVQQRRKSKDPEKPKPKTQSLRKQLNQDKSKRTQPTQKKTIVMLPESITVRELALRSNRKSIEIIKKLLDLGGVEEAAAAAAQGNDTSKETGIKVTAPLSHHMITQLKIEAKSRSGRMASQKVSEAAESMTVTSEIAELILFDMGIDSQKEVQKVPDEYRTNPETAFLTNGETFENRSPIVTVMGHVDHGKTSLLDALRNTSVAAGEAGGITQSVGAFKFSVNNQSIVFLDTPGHEAFASMRRCGSLLTDIIVLVIAATDGVRPQTVESIELAQAANVPIIVALTKIDIPGIKVDDVKMRISGELSTHNVITEAYGGNVQIVPIAAVKGIGLEDLSEAITLQAEELNLKADFKGRGEAVVLESRLDRAMGSIADIVTRWGTLKVGDDIVCGEQAGRVRQMLDTVTGKPVKTAPPSTPVRLIGLKEPPTPGTDVLAVKNAKRAKEVADLRQRRRIDTETEAASREHASALFQSEQSDPQDKKQVDVTKVVHVPILLKADTDGSLEALRYSVEAMTLEFQEKAKELGLSGDSGFQIIRRSVGPVSSSDLDLAKAFGAHIFAFNVRAPPKIMSDAERNKIPIVTQSVIYHLLDDLKALVEEKTPEQKEGTVLGQARVLQIFTMNPRKRSEGKWIVAGCSVVEGKITKNARLRVRRGTEIIHRSGLDSLRHFKQDVAEVVKGQECGISLSSFQEFEVDDIIEAYREN